MLSLCLGSCGSSADAGHAGHRNSIVVRIGAHTIDRRAVDRKSEVVAHGAVIAGVRWHLSGPAKEQALRSLIVSNWAIDEAARLHLPNAGEREYKKGLQRRRAAYGGVGIDEIARATGQTPADISEEVRAEVAVEAIKLHLDELARQITRSEAASFYRQNHALFVSPERRVTDLIEGIPSKAVAADLVRRVGTGASFRKRAFRETLNLAHLAGAGYARTKLVRAAFASRPGVPSAPMRLGAEGTWAVFIVKQILPAKLESFSAAKGAALSLVYVKRRRAIAGPFFEAYRRRWSAQTSCQPGYVVQGCSEYSGAARPEANVFERVFPSLIREGVRGIGLQQGDSGV